MRRADHRVSVWPRQHAPQDIEDLYLRLSEPAQDPGPWLWSLHFQTKTPPLAGGAPQAIQPQCASALNPSTPESVQNTAKRYQALAERVEKRFSL